MAQRLKRERDPGSVKTSLGGPSLKSLKSLKPQEQGASKRTKVKRKGAKTSQQTQAGPKFLSALDKMNLDEYAKEMKADELVRAEVAIFVPRLDDRKWYFVKKYVEETLEQRQKKVKSEVETIPEKPAVSIPPPTETPVEEKKEIAEKLGGMNPISLAMKTLFGERQDTGKTSFASSVIASVRSLWRPREEKPTAEQIKSEEKSSAANLYTGMATPTKKAKVESSAHTGKLLEPNTQKTAVAARSSISPKGVALLSKQSQTSVKSTELDSLLRAVESAKPNPIVSRATPRKSVSAAKKKVSKAKAGKGVKRKATPLKPARMKKASSGKQGSTALSAVSMASLGGTETAKIDFDPTRRGSLDTLRSRTRKKPRGKRVHRQRRQREPWFTKESKEKLRDLVLRDPHSKLNRKLVSEFIPNLDEGKWQTIRNYVSAQLRPTLGIQIFHTARQCRAVVKFFGTRRDGNVLPFTKNNVVEFLEQNQDIFPNMKFNVSLRRSLFHLWRTQEGNVHLFDKVGK